MQLSASAFEEYLQFFYLIRIRLTHENIADVLFLAKESLVEEFHDECTKFISETLSIENVCQTYELAKLHDYDDLSLSCERLIKSNLIEVFATNGFLNSNRTTVSQIVQLAGTKCQAKCVFDACILWAKNYCAQSEQDANNNVRLRAAFGDSLYVIRFDTMTFEEFMKYYGPFKGLFTEDERDEILQLTGKVTDFQPQWFKCVAKHPESPLTVENTDCIKREKTYIKCDRKFSDSFSH